MKKAAGVILKIFAGLLVLVIVLLFTVPVIFKQKIRSKVEESISSSLKATVKFEDYSLGFFRNFPNLTFSLSGLSVAGVDKFSNDTLASVRSFDMVFNLLSLFKKSGYEIKSILIDKAKINAIVLRDGSVNWDIMKESGNKSPAETEVKPSKLKVLMKKVSVTSSTVNYLDAESDMQGYLNNLNFTMKGDMTADETDLQLSGRIGDLTFVMEKMKYLNRVVADINLDLLADLKNMKFTFRENYLALNDLKLTFSGTVSMPADNIGTDLQFKTMQTSFGSLLSLIPAVYMKDYKDLRTDGEFTLSGTAKGIYSSADSTMPDITLSLAVRNGTISYPSLPDQIKNINISSDMFFDGKVTDLSTVNVDKFHMELAGSPFDMNFSLKTPISDPDFKGSAKGRIDLTAFSKAMPVSNMSISGIVDMAVSMAGKMSMIEKGRYDDFKAEGKISILDMALNTKDNPKINIKSAGLEFTPAYAALTGASFVVGKNSDFEIHGRLDNYIPYIFRNKTLKGNLTMHSGLTDVSQIMSEMKADTVSKKNTASKQDTTSLSAVRVPKNIDLDFAATIDELKYGNINCNKVKGHIIARDGVLSLREAGMSILNGSLLMNADYDTRDTLKPSMKADMDLKDIGVKDAFSTFNSVQMLAPAAKGIDGKVSVRIGFESLLRADMMPVIKSISGDGKLRSDELVLVESGIFDKVKSLLKLGSNYNNTFRNISMSFKINNGRIYVSPFDLKTGNLKMNIGGDQGLDQTMNYLVKTEMPRSDLGGSVNALIDNLSAQASAFGISLKPSDIIKVNLKVTGTFTQPVISPVFGNATSDSPGSSSVAKEAAGATKEKAKAGAEKQAAQLVKEAEAKGQMLRDEAAKAAENLRKEANARAKKLVDDSANKSSLEKMAAQKGADVIIKGADKKADQLTKEADTQANKLVEDAKAKGDELLKKI